MNKERRERLCGVADMIEDAAAEVEDIIAEEEDSFESLNEGLQACRSDQYDQDMESLQGICNDIVSLADSVREATTPKKTKGKK